jgi:hypothetical protein
MESNQPGLSSKERVQALAVAGGLSLSEERLDGLVNQATPYLEMIRALDDLSAPNEPAAIFRLDNRGDAR